MATRNTPMQSMPISPNAIQIFYYCAPQDEGWQKKLEQQLSGSRQNGLVTHWHRGQIDAGNDLQLEIDKHLNTAHMFLLLISADSTDSAYYRDVEKKALERFEKKEARVIPVILRPIDWKSGNLKKLQFLPRNEIPVSQWKDPEDALFHVAKEINRVIDNLAAREWLSYGSALQDNNCNEIALRAFKSALEYDPSYVEAYNRMGGYLLCSKR